MADSEIMNELFWRVKKLYEKDGGAYPDPVVKLAWDYGPKDLNGKVRKVDPHAIAKEINGYFMEDKRSKESSTKKARLSRASVSFRLTVQRHPETGFTASPILKKAT
jgi:formate dehydrogenase major subunit